MKLNQIIMSLIFVASFCSCNKKEDKDNFCLYANTLSINETIPFVNEFIAGLSNDLDSEQQQLQALIEWFKSKPCIIEANHNRNESYSINIWLDEDGITKEFRIYFHARKIPFEALYYQQIFAKIDNNWIARLMLKPHANEKYSATLDPEIISLINKHRVDLRMSAPGYPATEKISLLYTLYGKDNMENVINDFLATGKFEDDVEYVPMVPDVPIPIW